MGLLSALITLPLQPVRAAAWLAGKVAEAAEDAYHDPVRIRADLAELTGLLESGAISESEFDMVEDELLDRLAAAHESIKRSLWEGTKL